MKALKNNSALYAEQITSAIADCYRQNAEPTDGALMALYGFIGKSICKQGEKAFVVHLAEQLSQRFPSLQGFSPRNLRRMRDFYRTYEVAPDLMEKAEALNWTQNTVILECCETNEQRFFYISLAAEQSLSKLALMKAIEVDAFDIALSADTAQDTVAPVRATVGDDTAEQDVDTAATTKQPCGAVVTAYEPLRQGDGVSIRDSNVTAAVIVAAPKNRQSLCEVNADQASLQIIYAYLAPSPRFLTPIDKGKPPHDIPQAKKKNALPGGRTHSEIKQRISHQMPRVA